MGAINGILMGVYAVVLFKRCQYLPAGHCVTVVQAV